MALLVAPVVTHHVSRQTETEVMEIRYLERLSPQRGPLMLGQGLPLHSRGVPMPVAVGVWMCTLPFVGLPVAPWLGFKAAGGAALLVFVLIVGICWGLCSPRDPDSLAKREERR